MRSEETSAAAVIAGCRVVEVRDEVGIPRVEVSCPSGWAAARFLVGLAYADAMTDPVVRRLADRLRAGASTEEAYARAVHGFALHEIAFEREKGEIFQAPAITVAQRRGDCDCHARLVLALLIAGGLVGRLGFLYRGSQPAHVVAQCRLGGRWFWLETTIKRNGGAAFGEHPVRAAKRTGVLRSDVASNMGEVFMGGPVGVEGGKTYRMRVGVMAPKDATSAQAIEEGLRRVGFTDVKVWTDRALLPPDFAPHAREDVADAAWTVWAEALYAQAECAEVEMPIEVPADAREGVVSIVLDDLYAIGGDSQPVAATPLAATLGGVSTAHTSDLSAAFFAKMKIVCCRLRIDPEHALAIMYSESRLRSTAIHPTAPAAGIFGYMLPTREQAIAFSQQSAEQQLDAYEIFMRPHAGAFLPLAANLYQLNFVPASLARGTALATVIVARDGTGYGGREAGFYRDNAILDFNRDGAITVSDLQAYLDVQHKEARWIEALARLRAAPSPSGGCGAGAVLALLPWLALGAAIVYKIHEA